MEYQYVLISTLCIIVRVCGMRIAPTWRWKCASMKYNADNTRRHSLYSKSTFLPPCRRLQGGEGNKSQFLALLQGPAMQDLAFPRSMVLLRAFSGSRVIQHGSIEGGGEG